MKLVESLPLQVPEGCTMTQEDYTNFIASIGNFSTILYCNQDYNSLKFVTFSKPIDFDYVETVDTYDNNHIIASYNVKDIQPDNIVTTYIVTGSYAYSPSVQSGSTYTSYPQIINSDYYLDNKTTKGDLFVSSSLYSQGIKLNTFYIFNPASFKVSYHRQDLKLYFNPIALSIPSSSAEVGCKYKLISGFENVEETGLENFIELGLNNQLVLTGKLETKFVIVFEFYDKTNNKNICSSSFTINMNYTGGGGQSGGSNGATRDWGINTDFPTFPKGSMNPLDYLVYIFDLILALINMLLEFIGLVMGQVLDLGILLSKVFSFFPTPIPELFVIGIIVAILVNIKK
jgi:hypothetical protein